MGKAIGELSVILQDVVVLVADRMKLLTIADLKYFCIAL
jgi:hypothetical protein